MVVIILKAMNDVMVLVREGEETLNDDGFIQEKKEDERREVFCKVQSAKMAEYYAAMREGIKVTRIFIVCSFDYEQEKYIEYEEKRYKVERTYQTGEHYVELMCSEVE